MMGKTPIKEWFTEKKVTIQSRGGSLPTNTGIIIDVPGGGKDGRPRKIKLDIWEIPSYNH